MIAFITTSKGTFTHNFTTVANRVMQSTRIPVTELPTYILIGALTELLLPGQVFIRLNLGIQEQSAVCLTTQIVTDTNVLRWPPGRIIYPRDTAGELLVATVANPAAGIPLVYTVPTGSRQRVLSIRTALTSVGVNTPIVTVAYARAGTNLLIITSPVVHPAASARAYNFIAGFPSNEVIFNPANELTIAIPAIDLDGGDTITIEGQDGDDDWAAATVYSESFIGA
jgi:hypothetical protein